MDIKKLFLSLGVCLCFCLTGCWVSSVHPLYTKKDLMFEKALLGSWTCYEGDQKGSVLKFETAEGQSYKMTHGEDSSESEFSAHLIKLGDSLYLDTFPEKPEAKGTSYHKMHLYPMHSFLKIKVEGNNLTLFVLNYKWFEEKAKQGALAIKYEKASWEKEKDAPPLLTASPEELQKFLSKNMNEPEFFGKPILLKRSN